MENLIFDTQQRIIDGTANLMKHLATGHDFSSIPQVWNSDDEYTVKAAGANFVSMLVRELKQCRHLPVEHIQSDVRQLRRSYSRHFVCQEFRKAAKLHGRLWAIHVAKQFGYESLERRSLLFNEIEYLLNEVMSPIGVEGGTPVFADTDVDEGVLLDIYRQLPQFFGMSDYLDDETDSDISKLLSGTLVSPRWYYQESFGDTLDEDTALGLYMTIAERVEPLREPHTIALDDELVKSVTISEYSGLSVAEFPFRCLVGATTHQGVDGHDFYIALLSNSFSGSGLLVGSMDDLIGQEVVYKVYQAYTKAIEEETGNVMDIDAMVAELEDDEMDW